MKIPTKYKTKEDSELYGEYAENIQYERWVQDLEAQIEYLHGEIDRLQGNTY